MKKTTVMLNLFQHPFKKRFRNYLGLLFHTTQSLILFALQISFAMLRATSSFGLRPHTLSQNNTQLFCSAEYKIRKFGMTLFCTVLSLLKPIFHCDVFAFCTCTYLRCITKICIKLVVI